MLSTELISKCCHLHFNVLALVLDEKLNWGTKPTHFLYWQWFQDLLGHYDFRSKTHQGEYCPEGLCKAAMFALLVKEELVSWPEESIRNRSWLTIPEAVESCRYPWMREALVHGFLKWHSEKMGLGDDYHDRS